MGYGIRTSHPDRYKILKDFAKQNRKEMTLAERIMWEHLRTLQGYHFRRQHSIGDYIADFVCLKKRLVIEIDGNYHNTMEQKEDDKVRSANLLQLGYDVMRFTNDSVLNDIQTVIQHVEKKLLTMK